MLSNATPCNAGPLLSSNDDPSHWENVKLLIEKKKLTINIANKKELITFL